MKSIKNEIENSKEKVKRVKKDKKKTNIDKKVIINNEMINSASGKETNSVKEDYKKNLKNKKRAAKKDDLLKEQQKIVEKVDNKTNDKKGTKIKDSTEITKDKISDSKIIKSNHIENNTDNKKIEKKNFKIKNNTDTIEELKKTGKKEIKFSQIKDDDSSEDLIEEVKNILKSKSYNKKTLEQKIELSWIDIKNNFVKLIRQKNMYNTISLLYNKGNTSTRSDILNCTLKNIKEVSLHEHSKQFIIMLAESDKKYLVSIIKRIKEVCKDICISRNGLFVLDKIYKLSNRKSRNEIVNIILDINEGEDNNINFEEENIIVKGENIIEGKDEIIIEGKATNIIEKEENNKLKIESTNLIKKLSSKRLWKYNITHHILLSYLINQPNQINLLLDLFVRNKQLNLLVKTYKGLEVSIKLLETCKIDDIFRLLVSDFINIVNNEYGVIFVLKIMELNTEKMISIVDLYTEKYKEIFIEEVSVLPLLYIFNQERKYYPTLFNHLRSKENLNIDKTYLLKKYKEVIIENLTIFMSSFSYILVYFFCKKDDDIKKEVKKLFKEIPENDYTLKLNKKMLKYKLINK